MLSSTTLGSPRLTGAVHRTASLVLLQVVSSTFLGSTINHSGRLTWFSGHSPYISREKSHQEMYNALHLHHRSRQLFSLAASQAVVYSTKEKRKKEEKKPLQPLPPKMPPNRIKMKEITMVVLPEYCDSKFRYIVPVFGSSTWWQRCKVFYRTTKNVAQEVYISSEECIQQE